jgi:N-acetylglucosamine-6-phosphate deacetylase
MRTTLSARRLLTGSGQIEYPVVVVEDGVVLGIETGSPNGSTETLTECFFDIHVHGAVSYDFMAAKREEIRAVGRFLAGRGVGHYLPTTVTGPVDATLRALETLADAIEDKDRPRDSAAPAGIHLEGPFVSHAKRGVHPPKYLVEPSLELFEQFQEAARGHIKLMTIAPELPGALELIAHATASGVRVSLGHSDATEAEALAGIAAGAASATHTFNAMRALNQREPGILGTVLDRDDLYAEVICDGIHVHPALIRMWLKMKGEERTILITDGMSATGMPDGTYTLGDFAVEVKEGVCLSNGALAGSVLTMNQAVANLMRFTGSSLATAVRLASQNPARMLGMDGLTGAGAGCAANFNRYDETGRLLSTILHGRSLEH